MIELARTQDEEVGDGTTSVIILAAELLKNAEPFLLKMMHPRLLCGALMRALDDILDALDKSAITLDTSDRRQMLDIINTTLGTKFTSRFGDLVATLALDAVSKVLIVNDNGQRYVEVIYIFIYIYAILFCFFFLL